MIISGDASIREDHAFVCQMDESANATSFLLCGKNVYYVFSFIYVVQVWLPIANTISNKAKLRVRTLASITKCNIKTRTQFIRHESSAQDAQHRT